MTVNYAGIWRSVLVRYWHTADVRPIERGLEPE
jgi:hypothetical protein